MSSNLKIDNPCPFILTKFNKREEGYFCKSCNKTIIDFRDNTAEEIHNIINKGTCGIFNYDQLSGQQQMKFTRRLLFYFFSIISFLGFTIKPLNAQPKRPSIDSISNNIIANRNDKNDGAKSDTLKKKKSFFKRNKKHRVIGCPEF